MKFLHQFLTCPNGSASSHHGHSWAAARSPRRSQERSCPSAGFHAVHGKDGCTSSPGELLQGSALLQGLRMQGRWRVMGCAADEAVWTAEAALNTHFSCMPSSQNLLLIPRLPIFAANNRRKAASLAEFWHCSVFADKQELVSGLTDGERSFAGWTG